MDIVRENGLGVNILTMIYDTMIIRIVVTDAEKLLILKRTIAPTAEQKWMKRSESMKDERARVAIDRAMRETYVENELTRKAIVFFAKLIFRLERQGKIYLTNNENTIIDYLRNGDFSIFDGKE